MVKRAIFSAIACKFTYLRYKFALFLLISLLAQYLKIKSLRFERSSSQNSFSIQIKLTLAVSSRILSYTVIGFLTTFTKLFFSLFIPLSYKFVFLEYLNLKLESIQKIGIGSIHSLIYRRSQAFTLFIEILFSSSFQKIVFLVISIYNISTFFMKKDIFVALGSIILLSLFIIGIQYLRSYLRANINSSAELANSQKIDILTSYEKTISYGTLEDDILEFSKKLKTNIHYRQIYDCTLYLTDLICALFLLYFSKIMWRSAFNQKMNAVAHIYELVLYTEEFKSNFYNLMNDIDSFFLHLSNFCHREFNLEDQERKNDFKEYINRFDDRIEIKNLSIKTGDRYVIQDATFNILKHKKVAIIGRNGCGKSLFIKSLVGLQEYEGSIRIDYSEVKETSLSILSSILTYVSQNIRVFNRSLIENLKAGGTFKTEEEIVSISKVFNFKKIFEKIGFSKNIGQNGKLISGGQRQRIILLRAILRDKDIILFDNVFTGMDQKSEEDFVSCFKTVLKDKTVICSIQNLNLLPYFDEIIFFNDGKLEIGCLDALVTASSEFKQVLAQTNLLKNIKTKQRSFKLKNLLRKSEN